MNTKALLTLAMCAISWTAAPAGLFAQTVPAKSVAGTAEETITLSPFEVSSEKDYGYRKQSTVTTSRVAIPVIENPQAVEIISGELLKDFSVSLPSQTFRYTSSVVVGETEVGQSGIYTLRGFALPIKYNGLSLASSFGINPTIPVDNIDRVEIAKGAVSLYYGNSTPNGVANYVSKRPQFKNATQFEMTVGSFEYSKALLDTQGVISKNLGLAYRFITSYQDMKGRVDDQHSMLMFFDPSFTFRPNDKIEVTAELMATKQRVPYASFAYGYAVNPQYFTDVTNPSPQLIQYMQTAYNLATPAEALVTMNRRWGHPSGNPNGSTQGTNSNVFMSNWSLDIYGMTGIQPFYFTGSTIDWWRFSPRGDKFMPAGPESNMNGDSIMGDVSVVLTPVPNLSVRYHWLRMESTPAFTRQLINPNAGLRPNGRIISLNAEAALQWTPERYSLTDAQQVDASYDLEAFGLKHQFLFNAEWLRSDATANNASFDLSKTAARVNADGYTLSGVSAYDYWDPFSSNPLPPFYPAVSVGPVQTNFSAPVKFKAYALSYRLATMSGKLNALAGVRHTKAINTGREDDTPTVGAIYEVTPGFRVFASYSKAISFTNQLSWTGSGVLPSDNARLLDNVQEKGMEAGIKTNWRNGELSGTVSVFRTERDGLVQVDFLRFISDPRNSGPNAGTTAAQPWVNGGVHRVEGVDVDLIWTPNRNLQILTNFVYQPTAKIVTDKTLDSTKPGLIAWQKATRWRLQKTPLYHANLIAKYNFTTGPLQNLSLGGAIRYSDEYVATNGISFGVTVPRETIFDVFAIYSMRIAEMTTDLKLNVVNASDEINDITRSNGREARLSLGFRF